MITLKMIPEAEEEALLPRVIPDGWYRINAPGPSFICNSLTNPLRGVSVIFTASVEGDGRRWIHLSVSRPDRIPGWEDLSAVKRIFIGDERFAYQVIPPQREHYTLPDRPGRSGKVLHLWAPVDGEPPLPNFLAARGGTL